MSGIEPTRRYGHAAVDRPHLFQRFQQGSHRRLTLVEAPLGYGKTTLLQSWRRSLEERGTRTAYLSLEYAGSDGATQLAAALGILIAPDAPEKVGRSHTRLIALHQAEPQKVLLELPKFLAQLDRPACLFIDDFHAADTACAELVHGLVRAVRPPVHVVIGTREPPTIPLAKLRLNDEISDFGIEDLKFGLVDATALFAGTLPPEEVKACVDRSEGWIAALQLLRLSSAERRLVPPGQAGSLGQLTELVQYLNEQYFQSLSRSQQDLLIDTAHLGFVNGDLADHVRGSAGSWGLLSGLAQSNALVFEEEYNNGSWFRYHQLLRDFLLRKQAERGVEARARLHLRAADWLKDYGDLRAAIALAKDAGEPTRAAELLIEAGGVQYGIYQGAARLSACLDQIPHRHISASARLSVARAYLLLKAGRIVEAAELLKEIRGGADPRDALLNREIVLVEAHHRIYANVPVSEPQIAALEHMVAQTPASDILLRGLLTNFLCMFLIQTGQFEKARRAAENAMALYRDIGTVHLQFFMHIHLSVIELEHGHFRKALDQRRTAQALCAEHFDFDPSLRAIADVYLAEAELEVGEVAGVEERITKALELTDRSEGWDTLFIAGYETALTLSFFSGGYDAVVDHLERAQAMIARRGAYRFSNQLKMLELDMAVRAGADREAARLAPLVQRLLDDKRPAERLRWRGTIQAEMALARYDADRGDYASALDRLDRVEAVCMEHGLKRHLLRVRVRKMMLAAHFEQRGLARDMLRSALAMASPESARGAMVRERDGFPDAAKWVLHACGLGDFSAEEIALLADCLWIMSAHAESGPDILRALLTDKEHLVLGELARGHSNKMIARTLSITEPTVKFHLQNVYRKIGVNSRKLAREIALRHGAPGEAPQLAGTGPP